MVEVLLEQFGVGRVIWGTDWPVSATAGDYPPSTVAALRDVTAGLSPTEFEAVFAGNAQQTYASQPRTGVGVPILTPVAP